MSIVYRLRGAYSSLDGNAVYNKLVGNFLRAYQRLGLNIEDLPDTVLRNLDKLPREIKNSLVGDALLYAVDPSASPAKNLQLMSAMALLGLPTPPAIVQQSSSYDQEQGPVYNNSTNTEEQKQDTQKQPDKEKENNKKPIFKVSLSGDNLDGKTKLFFNGQGFVPYLVIGDNLFAVQGISRYSRSNGSTYEVDIGQVFNHLFKNGSLAQLGAFYQHRHDTAGDLDFRLGSLTSSFQSGRGKFSFYFGYPLSKEQLVSLAASSQIDTTEDGRITRSTRTIVEEMLYAWARKVATAKGEVQAFPDLRFTLGGAWYGGSRGYVLEGNNFREVRENVPDELRAIIGAIYSSQHLSKLFFGKNTEAKVEVRVGQGKPQYSVVFSVDLNRDYQRQDTGKLRARLGTPVDNLERIIAANSRVSKTITEKSPIVLVGDCPDTASEGSLYVCRINTDGIVEVVNGPPFLSLSGSNISNSASLANTIRAITYSGELDFDSAGSYPIELRIKNSNGLITKFQYTLVVQNTNRAPSFRKIGNKYVLENASLEFVIQDILDPDGDPVKITANVLPEGAVYNDSTRTFLWKTGFNSSGIYKVTFTADDGKGGTYNELVEINVENVNRPPSFDKIGDISGRENHTLEFKIANVSDPDGDSVKITASNLPKGATYNDSTRTFSWKPDFTQAGAYSGIKFTAEDSKGGTYSETISITVNDVNRPPSVTMDSPSIDTTILAGQSVNMQSTASDPDLDSLVFSWSAAVVSGGPAPSIASVEDPGYITFSTAGTYNLTVTVNDGKPGGIVTSPTRTITVNAPPPPPPG